MLLNNAMRLLGAEDGLAPRGRRDIQAGVDAGRSHVEDVDLAVAMAAGALLCLG